MAIQSMGKFTAIGMRTKVEDPTALIINTCANNDTPARGDFTSWSWSNPTNRIITHAYEDIAAVSVEALWQGCKIFAEGARPDPLTLQGDWRRGKAKRPIGAWAGRGRPLIRTPGEARRKIYIPAFQRLIEHWLKDREVSSWVLKARSWNGPVFLRDHDTGRGVDRNGAMSHAWVLASWLNSHTWPKT